MITLLIRILTFIKYYGWIGIITLFYKVSWKQDIDMINDGRDTWSFKKGNGYFWGTYNQRNQLWN